MPRADTWHHAYDEPLTAVIVPEAFSHPAKMAWALAKRLMQHVRAEWPQIRHILDPMAGIGVVPLAAAYAGFGAFAGELEAHFAALLQQNIALHATRLQRLGKPLPVVWRHDAMHLPLGPSDVGVVFSPPFSTPGNQPTGQGQAVRSDYGHGTKSGKSTTPDGQYGTHPAQIGQLGVVTSPPYANSLHSNDGREAEERRMLKKGLLDSGQGGIYGINRANHAHNQGYGETPQQIQRDYWGAMRQVYTECARVLAPGAPMILVVKGHVKDHHYVDLPAQTAALLEECGFTVVHWHNASLVAREGQRELFAAEHGEETRRQRKSFFRRLAENNGAPPIDQEVVLCAERM